VNQSMKHKSDTSVVLYGVDKVEYGPEGCTPYPMCVKSCANYLGQDVDYDYTMVSSGAAFRLTWDTSSWNGGNVDVIHTFDHPLKVYQLGIEALGREFRILARGKNSGDVKPNACRASDQKEDFIQFIKEQIDKGFPCIALGIIGPPEACIITGYRESGEVLLGWNFFQDAIEVASGVQKDESGYFITDKWWENEDTVAVMSMGEATGEVLDVKSIIINAIEVLSGKIDKTRNRAYAKGLLAYDAWKKAILDDSEFPANAILPLLAERMMCHGDAMDCLADGRHNAAVYFKRLSQQLSSPPEAETTSTEFANLCKQAEQQFSKVASNIWKMAEILGGYARNEKQMRRLADPEVRRHLARFIDDCKAADSRALEILKHMSTIL
jgi:hypothetical protein